MVRSDDSTQEIKFADGADSQPEGGKWAGISRELHVLESGIADGIGNGVSEAVKHPLVFAGEQLAPAGLMLAARGPAPVRTIATIAGLAGTAIFAEQTAMGIKHSLPALSDAYVSSSHLTKDQSVVAQQLGPLAFNSLVMVGVGVGAAKLGTALYGRMEFPVTGSDEPQRLPSGALARAVDRARPAMVRISGEIPGAEGGDAFQGSGFIFHSDGYVLTSWHNVDPSSARSFDVILNNGERRGWQLIKEDPFNDLAVLKITKASPEEKFPVLKLDLRDVGKGKAAVGLGYAGRTDVLEAAPTRYRGMKTIDKDFEVDPADQRYVVPGSTRNFFSGIFDHGQSGGPLLNSKGKVIGVITDRLSVPQGPELNFGVAARPRFIQALINKLRF